MTIFPNIKRAPFRDRWHTINGVNKTGHEGLPEQKALLGNGLFAALAEIPEAEVTLKLEDLENTALKIKGGGRILKKIAKELNETLTLVDARQAEADKMARISTFLTPTYKVNELRDAITEKMREHGMSSVTINESTTANAEED